MNIIWTLFWLIIKIYAVILSLCVPVGVFMIIIHHDKFVEELEFIPNMREHFQEKSHSILFSIIEIFAFLIIGIIALLSIGVPFITVYTLFF